MQICMAKFMETDIQEDMIGFQKKGNLGGGGGGSF